jgi:hypothetical protein
MPQQMRDVTLSTGEIVIQTDHLVTLIDKTIAEMTAEKSGTSSYKNSHDVEVGLRFRKNTANTAEGLMKTTISANILQPYRYAY